MINTLKNKFHYNRYKLVKGMLKKEGKLLDIGCRSQSPGLPHMRFLNYVGGDGIGLDIENIDNPDKPFIRGDITKRTILKSASFDCITALEIFEHIEEYSKAIVEIKRLLKPDGKFIMSTPNIDSILWNTLWWVWIRTFNKGIAEEHIVNLTKETWEKILLGYFNNVKVSYGQLNTEMYYECWD